MSILKEYISTLFISDNEEIEKPLWFWNYKQWKMKNYNTLYNQNYTNIKEVFINIPH